MVADDDGFINNPKSIVRQSGATEDDLKLLLSKKYILAFDSGVIVIKHWRIHNYIQKDRYNRTINQYEKSLLNVSESNEYELPDFTTNTECIQNVSIMDTQVRLGKDRLGKDRLELGESVRGDAARQHPPTRHKYGEYNNVLLSDEELEKFKSEHEDWERRIESLSEYIASTGKKYKSHLATLRRWAKNDKEKTTNSSDVDWDNV